MTGRSGRTGLPVVRRPMADDRLLFDTTDPDFLADPFPTYARLRGPKLHVGNPPHTWVTATHALCTAVLRDPRFCSDPAHANPDSDIASPNEGSILRQEQSNVLLFLDPPDHTRLRRLANKAFTPRAVERMRADITAIAERLIDEMVAAGDGGGAGGTVRFMDGVARPLPLLVICSMLGVPTDDRTRFFEWSDPISRLLDDPDDPAVVDAGTSAGLALAQYYFELAEDRRAHPGDDLLTALLRVEDEGDTFRPEELLSLFGLLFIAGHETTTNLLGNGLLALLRNPDQLAVLRSDPSLVPGGVDELLRYDAPVQLTARIASTDIELGDNLVPAGDQVVTVIAGANRDPDEYPEPAADRLDVRRDARSHLAFGSGIHYCLGASLAKLEAAVCFDALLRRFPRIELADDHPTYRDHFVLRGLNELAVSVGA